MFQTKAYKEIHALIKIKFEKLRRKYQFKIPYFKVVDFFLAIDIKLYKFNLIKFEIKFEDK